VFPCDARGDMIREQYHLQALLSRRVDGLIVVGRQTDVRASLGPTVPVPVVYAYAPSQDPDDVSLTPGQNARFLLDLSKLVCFDPATETLIS